MTLKRKFKKLLRDRRDKLQFTIMDQRFYKETNTKLLSVNVEKLSDKIIGIESELKARENWKGDNAVKEKEKLTNEYQTAQKLYGEVMAVRQKLIDLDTLAEDYRKYIQYMEAYIGLKRWEK